MKYKYYVVYIYAAADKNAVGTCYVSRSSKIKSEEDIQSINALLLKEYFAGVGVVSLLSWTKVKK